LQRMFMWGIEANTPAKRQWRTCGWSCERTT